MRHQQGRHPRFIQSKADPVAGHSRLRHLKESAADAIAVAYAHFIISQSLDGEVFSKVSASEIVAMKLGLPITIRVELINHHGPYFAAVSRQVCLRVTINIEAADHPPIANGRLPYGSANGCKAPLDIARQANVYRNETRHLTILPHASYSCRK